MPLRSLVKDSSNHDIDVSFEEGKARAEESRNKMEKELNKLGEGGWELVCSYGEFVLLKKEK